MTTIDAFNGPYRFLSNFWPAVVKLDGVSYPSVEHAYVAAKSTDLNFRDLVLNTASAGKVKALGRTVKIRDDWELLKYPIMADLVWLKFQHDNLKTLLLDTWPRQLVEGNNWGDTYWGVCNGTGLNHLGKILMDVRGRLRNG